MLKENPQFTRTGHKALDVLLSIASYYLAAFLRFDIMGKGDGLPSTLYPHIPIFIAIIWPVVFDLCGAYEPYRNTRVQNVLLTLAKSVCLSVGALILTLYLLKITDISRLMMGFFLIIDFCVLGLSKTIIHHLLRQVRSNGYNTRNILIVGTRRRAQKILAAIRENNHAGFHVIGCLDIKGDLVGATIDGSAKVIGTCDNIEQVLRSQVVDELIFAMPLKLIDNADQAIILAENMGVNVRIVPDWQLHYLMFQPSSSRISFRDFLGIPTMKLSSTPPNTQLLHLKYGADYILALLLTILALPLMAACSLVIKIASPSGPILYRQERIGLNGRRFILYKFRTMATNADELKAKLNHLNEMDGPVFKISNDPRIIPFAGRFLRRTGLDELPQLFNILKGDMSLVGPRPPIPAEVDDYATWHRRRLSMKPGVTCLWQISPRRNELTFDRWVALDLKYIDNWSLWLDCKILFGTLRAVLFGSGR